MRTKVVVAVTVLNVPDRLRMHGPSGLNAMIDASLPLWKDPEGNKAKHRFEKNGASADLHAGELGELAVSHDSWGKVVQVRFRTLDSQLSGHRLVAYKNWAAMFFAELEARMFRYANFDELIHCTVEILQIELIGDTLGRTYEM